MKNAMRSAISAVKVLAVLVALSAVPLRPVRAAEPTPTRVNWEKEGRSLVWEAAVPAKSGKFYVFKAIKGQILSLGFIDDTGEGSLDLGKYSVEPNTDPMVMPIPQTKDYTLSLFNNSNKAASFRISFNLEEPKTVVHAERIVFNKDIIEYQMEKTVAAHRTKSYVFSAKAKQEITFTITPKNAKAKLSVKFDGKSVAVGKPYTVIASKNGDHSLQVSNSDKVTRGFYFDIGVAYLKR